MFKQYVNIILFILTFWNNFSITLNVIYLTHKFIYSEYIFNNNNTRIWIVVLWNLVTIGLAYLKSKQSQTNNTIVIFCVLETNVSVGEKHK